MTSVIADGMDLRVLTYLLTVKHLGLARSALCRRKSEPTSCAGVVPQDGKRQLATQCDVGDTMRESTRNQERTSSPECM